MRLQLIALLVAVPVAAAEPGAGATLRVYSDDDGMTVVSPSVRAATSAAAFAFEVDATADAVSGASVDVVTSASPLPIREQRLELGLGVVRALPWAPRLATAVRVRGSWENDHGAVQGEAALRAELVARHLTIDARYLAGHERVGSVNDPDLRRSRTRQQGTLGVSIVASPRTVVDVVAVATLLSGYHASPYRRVPLTSATWPTPSWHPEATPVVRDSLAVAGRLRYALGATWFGALGYGGYTDTWDVTSHTVTLDARRQLSDRVLAGASVRGYLQDRAFFYRSTYEDELPAMRTRDRTLGTMRTLFGSVTADVTVDEADRWHVLIAGGLLASWFPQFPLQRDRHALVFTLAVSRPFTGDVE